MHYLQSELFDLVRSDSSIFNFFEHSALDGIWFWDLENPDQEWMSDQFWETLGFDPSTMPHSPSSWQTLINAEDAAKAQELLEWHFNNPDSIYNQIIRYTHKEGHTKWIKCRGKIITDTNGKPKRMLGAHIDVTQVFKKQEIITEKYKTIKGLLNTIPDNLLVTDTTGIIIEYHPFLSNPLLEIDKPEIIGSHISKHLPPKVTNYITHCIKTLKNQDDKVDLKSKTVFHNHQKWYECKVHPIGDGQFLQIFRNITQEKQRESDFRQLQRFQKLIINIIDNFISTPYEKIDNQLEESLGKIGEFVAADRAYIFEYDFHNGLLSNTHEWCAPKVLPEIHNLQKLPIDLFPDWIREHKLGNPIYVPDVKALPVNSELRKTLEPQGIKTLLTIPIIENRNCFGFVGFDWVNYLHEIREWEQELLDIYSNILLNVSQRRSAEEKLRQEQHVTQELISNIEESVIVYDLEMKQLDINHAFCKMTGFTRGDLIDQKFPYPYLPNDQVDKFSTLFQELEKGKRTKFFIHFKKKNGQQFPVRIKAKILKGDHLKPLRYFATVEDVTYEQRKAEHLARTVENLEETSKLGRIGIWEIDTKTRENTLNEVGYELLNINPGGLFKSELKELSFSFDDKTISGNDFVKRLKQLNRNTEFKALVTGQNGERWLRFIIQEDPERHKIRCIMQDIHAQTLLRMQLSESQNWLNKSQELSRTGTFSYNYKTKESKQSKMFEEILCYCPSTKPHINEFLEDILKANADSLFEEVNNIISEKKSSIEFSCAVMIRDENESKKKWIEFKFNFTYDEHNQLERMHGTVRDISNIYSYISQITDRNKKLEKIAWIQSHSFRSPVANILGLVKLIKEEGFEKENDLSAYISLIEDSAVQLDKVINGITELTTPAWQ
jgi:PAS domain S-box-containing protein